MRSARQSKIRGPAARAPKLSAALAALGLMAALMAACNGGADGESSPTAQPTAGGSPTLQPTGQAATNEACQALTSLKSYRYVSDVTLESPEELVPVPEGQLTPLPTVTRDFLGPFYLDYNTDASVIAPDRIEASITGAGNPFDLIIIGDQRWVTLEGKWQEVGPQYGVSYQPIDICNAIFAELNLDQAQAEKETVNKVSTLHYTFPATPSGGAMATIFGPGSDMDLLLRSMNVEVWVAEEGGWLMRLDVQANGVYINGRELRAHIRVELRDINDKNIKIEAPL